MGLIKKAKYISADPAWGRRTPKFRKQFALAGELESAELQISALGIYEAFVNGKRVGDAVLTPYWTEYEKRIQYLSYDITDMLCSDNDITVGVGSGWWGERMGFVRKDHAAVYGEIPALIAAISLKYKDGREELIVTDESWAAAKSETLFTSIYDGEKTDARVVPNFCEKVFPYEQDVDKLVAFEGEYVRELERIQPKKVIVTPKGETVIDFGQEITGYLKFNVTGKAGHTVKVRHAEILDKDGNFYTENYRGADALIEYTLKDGAQTYKAKYTFYGFRYIQLIDWCEEVKPENFEAIVICSDMKRTGYFKCGHAKINKLYENIIWGQKGNYVDVPTDCPQRDERLGWTGDTEVFCRTGCLNYDTEKFFKKWLHDLSLAQRPDGMVPRVVPNCFINGGGRERGSAGWGDAATVVPYEVYMAYGDKTVLADSFEAMKKWVGFIEGRSENYIWTVPGHFGDWLGLDAPEGSYRGSTNEQLIATAYFYLSCGLTVKTGKILGEDVSKYEDMLPKIKEAFNREYIKDGKLTCDTQTAHVLAIHFGLANEEVREALGRRLIELIEAFDDRLQTGFVGTPYLLDTLTEIGRVDKAYTLLLQEKFPSWLFSVNMGATTIWEHWDGLREDGSVWSKDMNSFNHYAYGAVASWMYRTVCGIRYDENAPAYKHFFISPIPDKRLGFAKSKLDTRNGTIVSEWVYESDCVRYTFTVPQGSTATVTVDGVSEELEAGRYTRYGKVM